MRLSLLLRLLVLLAALGGSRPAWSQGAAPTRQIPPAVLTELHLLENRFEVALAADCDTQRCFSKGCTYMDHAVADQPRAASLPGLGQDPGPGSVAAQEYLTRARCSFAHEASVTEQDVQALMRRLRSKLSKGWLAVTIDHQALEPLPATLQDPPVDEPEAEVVAQVLPPEPLSAGVAARELWTKLLPNFPWMIGVVLLTMAGILLVWAWRRVGRESPEDRALMAQLARSDELDAAGGPDPGGAPTPSDEDRAFVARQSASWSHRLEANGPDHPDPELQAMIRELLRSRDLPLLAKAVLRFPDSFLAAFPAGGDIATAKLELADYLKTVDLGALPSDLDFFRALDRHARAAALVSQSDAEIVRSLREEFGATGLATLMRSVDARIGALLFALAPPDEQHELVRLLSPRQMAEMAEQLLRSNRMNQGETAHLFQVLEAARADRPLPPAPRSGEVSDRGASFEATSALSVLLPNLGAAQRRALFGGALERFHGSFPAWYRGIFLADLLFEIPDDARTDLLLELDVQTLAAWLSLVGPETRDRLVDALPDSLRAAVAASGVFPSRAYQLALAERGRQDLARGFQRQLAKANLSFERVVHADTPTGGP